MTRPLPWQSDGVCGSGSDVGGCVCARAFVYLYVWVSPLGKGGLSQRLSVPVLGGEESEVSTSCHHF